MGPTDPAMLTSHTRAERERLAILLTELTPAQWDADSLCAHWRIRDVAAHLTMPYRTKGLAMVRGMVRAGMNFNRFAEREAREAANAMSGDDLAELLGANADNRWAPPGGGATGALSHDVIHGLDITEPLGLPPAPSERIALVISSASDRQLKYFGVDLTGLRLVANDADVSAGKGPREQAMTAKELLLTITGRRKLSRA